MINEITVKYLSRSNVLAWRWFTCVLYYFLYWKPNQAPV